MRYIVYSIISMSLILCRSAENQQRINGIIRYPPLITFAHENGKTQEEFDLSEDEGHHYESFVDRINKQVLQQRFFIVARLLTVNGANDEKVVSYFEAATLNRWWFRDTLYGEKEDTLIPNELLQSKAYTSFKKHPESQLLVRGEIPYFMTTINRICGNQDVDFNYIGSSYDLMEKQSLSGRYLRSLLLAHYATKKEVQACKDACNFLRDVYAGTIRFSGVNGDAKMADYYQARVTECQREQDGVAAEAAAIALANEAQNNNPAGSSFWSTVTSILR